MLESYFTNRYVRFIQILVWIPNIIWIDLVPNIFCNFYPISIFVYLNPSRNPIFVYRFGSSDPENMLKPIMTAGITSISAHRYLYWYHMFWFLSLFFAILVHLHYFINLVFYWKSWWSIWLVLIYSINTEIQNNIYLF